MDKKVYLKCISIDVTRRCNMNCLHCFRGDAEDHDMTTEIIDRLLDEVQDFGIWQINITGGEPCLNPDIILYLANQIVNRNIKVATITMPTSGTIQSETIKEAFCRMAEYMVKVRKQRWYRDICKYLGRLPKNNVEMMISQYAHDNYNILTSTKNYYNAIPYSTFKTYIEKEKDIKGDNLVLSGRLKKNYRDFPEETQRKILAAKKDGKHCLIDDSNDNALLVCKTFSISTDGTIYIGSLCAWDKLKEKSVGNILNCNNDLISIFDDYSWRFPINKNAYNFRSLYQSLVWHRAHNIELDDKFSPDVQDVVTKYQQTIDYYEKILRDHHKTYPYLNHSQINSMTVATMAVLCLRNARYDDASFVLMELGGLTQKQVNQYVVGDLIKDLEQAVCKLVAENEILRTEREMQLMQAIPSTGN